MKAQFENLVVTSTFAQAKNSPTLGDEFNYTRHNRVTIRNLDNGRRTSFDFWGSRVDPEIKTEYDLLNAVLCFVDDAIAGEYDFDEFVAEYGFDKPSQAYRTWKACINQRRKLKRMYDGDIYELANRLSEDYA